MLNAEDSSEFLEDLGRHLVPLLLIFSFVLLSFVDHGLNVFLAQKPLVISDGNLVLFSCTLIHIRDIEDAIGSSIKSDFNLRNTTRCMRYACESKLAKLVVILRHGMLTRLVVREGREGLCVFGRNGAVALDEDSHDFTNSLHAKGKRSDIQQQQIFSIFGFVSREDGCLDSCTISNSLIRIDTLIQLFSTEEVLQEFLNLGNTGRATHQDNIMDLGLVKFGILKGFLYRVQMPQKRSAFNSSNRRG